MNKPDKKLAKSVIYISSSKLVAITLVAGISLSVGISWLVWLQERNFLTARFEKEATIMAIALQEEIDRHWKIFSNIHYFYQSSEAVEAQEFQIYGQGVMSHHPSVQVLAWFPTDSRRLGTTDEELLESNSSSDRPQDWDSLTVAYMVSKSHLKISDRFDFAKYPETISDLQKARDIGKIIPLQNLPMFVNPKATNNNFQVWAIWPMYRSSVTPASVEARRQSLYGFMLNIFNLDELISQTLADLANRDPLVKNSHMVWWRSEPNNAQWNENPTDKPANNSTTPIKAPPQNRKKFVLFYHGQTGKVTNQWEEVDEGEVVPFLCRSRSDCTHQIYMGNEQWLVEFLPTEQWFETIAYWKIWMTLLLSLSTTAFLSLYLTTILGRQHKSAQQADLIEHQHQELLELKDYQINAEMLLASTQQESDRITKENEQLKQVNANLQQINTEIMLVGNMSHLLQACVTEEEAYATISEFIQKLFPTELGAIYLMSDSNNIMEAVKTWGENCSCQQLFSSHDCWALRSGREYFLDRLHNAIPCKHYHSIPEQSLCIPLVAQGETLGLLYLETSLRETKLNPGQLKLAVSVGKHIGLALANLKLRQTLKYQSIRDPLTGLYNRRYLEEFINQQIHRAQRNHQPFALLMIDVDHFKRFNDTFGHDAGDRILQELGRLLTKSLRGSDVACRYGGEELTLVLPEISWENAQKRAEQIRQDIKELKVRSGPQLLGQIAASFGVALFPDDGLTAEALFENADAALYRAKAQGRDRVIMASDPFIETLGVNKSIP